MDFRYLQLLQTEKTFDDPASIEFCDFASIDQDDLNLKSLQDVQRQVTIVD